MRTTLFLVGGLALWALCVLVSKVVGGSRPLAATGATIVFAVIWFVVAAWNMWNGVSHAGYSASEELPIFLLIFLVPVLVATILTWRFL